MTDVHVLGVRHHGPGSARAVAGVLAELAPDCILIEGPPELDTLTEHARRPGFVLPVAALVYAVDEPTNASFYPYASFSPEWVALRYALDHDVEVGFADLPAANRLAAAARPSGLRTDPIGALAAVAGYDDAERFWEDAIEQRGGASLATFDAIGDAMAEVRAGDDGTLRVDDELLARREAAMRKRIRAARRAGRSRIAVVCGAYHAPALRPNAFPTQAADNRLLTRLPKVKVTATWVPWSTPRLAYRSGYGAGVESPGWYEHLFDSPSGTAVGSWIVRTARALRDQRLDTSPAAAVEATRLAEALAALRGRPSVGLAEVLDAAQAVLCEGSAARLQTVARDLLVGDRVGTVPSDVPSVPLATDLERTARRLRMKRTAAETELSLDLRKPLHLERSVVLRRLDLLGIPWGSEIDAGPTTGSFRETWLLEWHPEFEVRLVEASPLGPTVAAASSAAVVRDAEEATDLHRVARLIDAAVPADLPDAVRAAIGTFARRAAQQHDTVALLRSVGPLARVQRYGDVRGVDQRLLLEVLRETISRIAAGLDAACAGVDDETAAAIVDPLVATERSVGLVADPDLRRVWHDALDRLARRPDVPGLLVGRAVRALVDVGRIESTDASRRLSQVLSVAAAPAFGARWLEGFLAGDASLLLHDLDLLGLVDDWINGASETTFDDLLPLLRRTFAGFSAGDRRALGARVRDLGGAAPARTAGLDLDTAAPIVARIAELVGATP